MSANKSIQTNLLGARVSYLIPVMELTPEQSSQMLVASKTWDKGGDYDEERRTVWPRLHGAIVNVYVVDGSPSYTIRLDRSGKLVDAGRDQIEVL